MKMIETIFSNNKLIPVVALVRVDDTIPLCEALLEGGISAIEITLRTDVALDCIAVAVKKFPEMSVGAGTILTADQVKAVCDLGAAFGVSPGLTETLQEAIEASGLVFLPGASSASEVMRNAEYGYKIQKFYPAEAAGGVDFLKSLSSPFPTLKFCATGGVNLGNIKTYLTVPNVICVGGSWFVSPEKIKAANWANMVREIKEILSTLPA